MTLFWPYLVLALVLLWTPLVRYLGHTRRRQLLQVESSHRIPPLALLRCFWNWLDLLRSVTGTWMLVNIAILPSLDPKLGAMPAVSVRWALLAVGIALQAVGSSQSFSRLTIPVFYLLGLTVALLPWQGVVFGGVLALVLADMLRGWVHLSWLMPLSLAAALWVYGLLGPMELLLSGLWVVPGALRLFYPCVWVLGRVRMEGQAELDVH